MLKKISGALILVTLLLAGCSQVGQQTNSGKLPTATFSIGDETLKAEAAGYQWRGTVADAVNPDEAELENNVVAAGSEVTVVFSERPQEVIWQQWPLEEQILVNAPLTMPNVAGIYRYLVEGRYEDNEYVDYYFQVEIK
ncbi:hypothetical protein [Enterococcus timonensis]|uniref:hypothetical protein n=1 Tax=Enterococcus timonensis TaxID=1852364 RepID=UPI0008DA5D04|nr:hypothetical protein [Enterococcus timonensis]